MLLKGGRSLHGRVLPHVNLDTLCVGTYQYTGSDSVLFRHPGRPLSSAIHPYATITYKVRVSFLLSLAQC